MKALVFVTYADCENKWRSLEAAGYEVVTFQYDRLPHKDHRKLVEEVRRVSPHFAVFIGALDGPNHNVPSVDILKDVRDYAPFIHMCNDAADKPWWSTLEQYDKHECFDVQVAIDGAPSPITRFRSGLTLLTPIDTRPFVPKPWDERKLPMGMSSNDMGNWKRGDLVRCLAERGHLKFRKGTADTYSYKDYAEFMCQTKIAFNHPQTGSAQYYHVKGRVVEAGFAGCCLLERKDSPTRHWFTPGVDYIEYEGDGVQDIYDALRKHDHNAERIAQRFEERVKVFHSPNVFWITVLAKAGVA